MSSIYYGGSVRMNPEVENKNFDPMFNEGYPYEVPKVYLDGRGETYYPQCVFSWNADSVVVVKDKRVMKYTRSSFVEIAICTAACRAYGSCCHKHKCYIRFLCTRAILGARG